MDIESSSQLLLCVDRKITDTGPTPVAIRASQAEGYDIYPERPALVTLGMRRTTTWLGIRLDP